MISLSDYWPLRSVAQRAATQLILLAQHTPLRGTGSYASLGAKPSATPGAKTYAQADEEARRVEEFFEFFDLPDLRRSLAGKTVLDLGSGYGGRTVKYATAYGAAKVIGIEIHESVVTLAREYAAREGATNCVFEVCQPRDVGVPSESIDVVVSYDVLEHVQDPRVTLDEIRRVLKPGGLALIVFTPYHGMLSHHLGYITRIPGIHWFFSPETLVAAINSLLSSDRNQYATAIQPPPAPSYNGRRLCLPSLNGLTGREFRDSLRGFEVLELRQAPVLARYHVGGAIGARVNEALMSVSDWTRDAFSFNLSCILRKT